MRVQVLKQGYFDLKRRNEGDIIEVDPKLFSEKWMKKLSEGEKPASKKKSVKAEPAEEVSLEEDVI
jgi:hypothetical protein